MGHRAQFFERFEFLYLAVAKRLTLLVHVAVPVDDTARFEGFRDLEPRFQLLHFGAARIIIHAKAQPLAELASSMVGCEGFGFARMHTLRALRAYLKHRI